MPASTITRIESGEMDPTFGMLQKIATAAGYTLGEVTDSGADDAIAVQVDRLAATPPLERPKAARKLTRAAAVSPSRSAAVRSATS